MDVDDALHAELPMESLSKVADGVKRLRSSVDAAISVHSAQATTKCMARMLTALTSTAAGGQHDAMDLESDDEADAIVVTGAAGKKLQGQLLSHDMPQEAGLLRAALLRPTVRAVDAARAIHQLRQVQV